MAFRRDAGLPRRPIPGAYDLGHLQRFHHRLFRDVFAWAGELRTVNITRTARFAHHRYLIEQGKSILPSDPDDPRSALARIPAGLKREVLLDELTELLGDINALHPFREGNGRAQRAFLRQMVAGAGWKLDWSLMDPQENNAASRASLADPGRLRVMLDRLLVGRIES